MQHALLVVVIVLVCLVDRVSAQNTGFLPGDAFFHTVVTEASLDKVSADSEVVLEYIRPKTEEGSFSGYAGYWKLRLPTSSLGMVSRLKTVYKSIRLSVPKEMREYSSSPGDSAARAATEIVETNGLHVFVYNADFDFHRYALGLRYNETWVEDTASFGPNPKSVRLELFVNDRDAFSADWRDASVVSKLGIICPAIPDQAHRKTLGTGNARIDVPLELQAPIQLIVLPKGRLEQYFHKKNGAYYFSITDAGTRIHTREKGKWDVKDWPLAREDR